ncbi:hypothetical protein BJ165DRAFT_1006816 [Panaeolus papilionaceus]|nr:hypothetical protein BJ165DRAFT_1006816 [Panaeolus papilionaceus]
MSLIFVSETSTRRSSLNLSYSDINLSQFDMQIDPAPDVDVKPVEETGAATEEERDPLYFCENVVLKAEDRIFSVPRSGLIEHGTYFQSLFSINQEVTNGIVSDAGSSEKHPIILDGVSKIHFHNLLRLIYPMCTSLSSMCPIEMLIYLIDPLF